MIKFSYKRGLNRFRINTVLTKKLNVLNETKNRLNRNLSPFYNKKIYYIGSKENRIPIWSNLALKEARAASKYNVYKKNSLPVSCLGM